MESLRKECEAAKKKAKSTLEKYFAESDRLKAIIDEMQGMLYKLLGVFETWLKADTRNVRWNSLTPLPIFTCGGITLKIICQIYAPILRIHSQGDYTATPTNENEASSTLRRRKLKTQLYIYGKAYRPH